MTDTKFIEEAVLKAVQEYRKDINGEIKVGVSQRHIHLSREHLDILFGEGYELTKKKTLMGREYASEECVTLVGPSLKAIEKVRVLGPVRKATQVEISRTDTFILKVSPPVRPSGQIKNSEKLVKEMKSTDMLDLNEYATAENCFLELVDDYDLQGYSKEDARKIASVCYELRRIFFKIGTPYTFAKDVPDEIVANVKENGDFYKGVDVRVDPVRKYADGTLAPHILGRIGAIDADEYKEKKLKLLCDEKGLGSFCDKIQKIFVLKKSGMLSDSEFEANKNQIVDECFATDIKDLKLFKENMTKLPIILMSELVTEAEFDMKKQRILDSVAYNPLDSNDVFCLKLQKLPILRDCELVPASEYDSDVKELKAILEPKASDALGALDMKLGKWPAMVKAGTITESEYKERQQRLISEVMTMPAGDEDSFRNKAERVIKMKEKGWLSELDFHGKKVEILKEVNGIEDYILRTKLYMVAKMTGLISAEDYAAKKAELIKDVFSPYGSMEEFQEKVNMLMKLNNADIITDEEYVGYKNKLMNEL